MDKYMEDMLKVADEVLADVKREKEKMAKSTWINPTPIPDCEDYAVVTKDKDGVIHLDMSCNPGEEYYTIESYCHSGWFVRAEDLTRDNFWCVFSTWNGYVCGDIYLDDYDYEDEEDTSTPEWDSLVAQYKLVNVEDLKTLPPGEYAVKV